MLQQKLQLKLLTKLSPQQIQTIKLLEIPTLELEERIRQEVEENPALEIIDDPITSSNNESNEKNEEREDNDDDFDSTDFERDSYINDYTTEDDVPEYALEGATTLEPTQALSASAECDVLVSSEQADNKATAPKAATDLKLNILIKAPKSIRIG